MVCFIFGFGSFFRYHNFKNEIDAWETTVQNDPLSETRFADDPLKIMITRRVANKYSIPASPSYFEHDSIHLIICFR